MARKCLYPFSNLTINPTGSVAPCCKFDVYHPDKANTPLEQETLYTKNIEELFYQPAMENIRQDFLHDREPEGCNACWKEEAAGIISMRQHRENTSMHKSHRDKYRFCYEDPKIISLDLKFSSLCNLKCRICGPYCSSTWLKESLDTGNYHEHTIKIFSKYSERKFINKEENFEILQKLLPNLRILEFHGGEPLMQPEHNRIMDILENYPNVEDLKLNLLYNTNGTIFDEKVVNVWNKMGLVDLNISLDDIKDRFEYQRYPANWLEVLENIKKFKTYCNDNVKINLYCTVSLYNVFYIDEFIKYNNNNLRLKLIFSLLHWPEYMSIKHLPNGIKDIIKSKIDSLTNNDLLYISNDSGIYEVVNFMMNNQRSDEEFKKFILTTEKHDHYRSQSFKNTFLEYWKLLNE